MLTGEKLGQAIGEAIRLKGVTQRAVAAHFGVKPPSVQDWIKRGTIDKAKLADLWAYFADVVGPEHWGMPADRHPVVLPDISMAGLSVQEPEAQQYGQAAQPPMSPILAWEHPDDLPEGEFVMIPRLDVTLSAGPGREQHVDVGFTKAGPQAFRADWIRAERLKPAKLAAMTAKGESMEPAIFDGDSLLIDTSQTDVQDGRVYALWYEGGERVKRLYRLPGGGLRIQSDNPRHLSMDIPPTQTDAVRIIGRVVIRSGRGGL